MTTDEGAKTNHPNDQSQLGLLEQLRQITTAFAAVEDVNTLVVVIDNLIDSTVSVPYYGFYLIDPDTGQFRLPLSRGLTPEESAEAERTAMDRHPGWVLRNRKTLHVPDIDVDSGGTVSSRRSFVVRSRLWIPVMARDECVGAFGMADTRPHAFSEIHISLLTFVSNLAGIVYRNLTFTAKLQSALERAEAADRSKTAFLANMSHELRTPMNGVLGAASLLATTRLDTEQRELLSTVQTSARSMVSLVDDLLESSKIDAGKLTLRTEDVSVATWLDSAVEIIVPTLRERRLRLAIEVEPDTPHGLRIDALKARQILLNLLSNALKFTEYGGITIRLARGEEGAVALEVEDTGIGVPPEKAHLLFGRFSQVDDSITRRFGGTGLGLMISRQLAEAMGGSLALTSSVPGRGSVFTLHLPSAPLAVPSELRGLRVSTTFADAHLERACRLACAWWGCELVSEGADRVLTDDLDRSGPGTLRVGSAPEAEVRIPIRMGNLRDRLLGLSRTMDGDAEGALHPEAHGGTVLVVDDHPINRLVAVRSLATMGYRVLDASDTRAAADLIEAERIDACLLDVHMPDEDGIAFTNRLRRGELGPAGRTLPVIAFTADLLTQTHDLCRAAGMLGVIHKPMSPARLAEGVAHAVSAGRRVLVVDDDATNRVILSRMLEHLGVDVHVADSQRSALERLAEGPYRYIILDEHLGDGTGHEVVTALRSLEVPWRRVPVISSTATSVDQVRERVYDDALPKPIELEAVAKIVERWGPPPLPSAPSG